MSKRRSRKPDDDDDEEVLAQEVVLLCGNCGERHIFESLGNTSLMEGVVTCDSCGKNFIGPAIERRQAFIDLMKTDPAKARKLASSPLWLEAFIRGKKIPGFE